jgi:hypothetical protein
MNSNLVLGGTQHLLTNGCVIRVGAREGVLDRSLRVYALRCPDTYCSPTFQALLVLGSAVWISVSLSPADVPCFKIVALPDGSVAG